MDKIASKKALLDHVRASVGDSFECNETAYLAAYTAKGENQSSLAIKILSIAGGFLATLSGLGFLFLAGLYDSEMGLLVTGILFIASSLWLNNKYDKLIIDTFSISVYLSGIILFAVGMMEMDSEPNTTAVLIAAIGILALFITQNFILSFVSVLTISGAFAFICIDNFSYEFLHIHIAINTLLLALWMLNEAKIITSHPKLAKLYNPMRIGLLISLLVALITVGRRWVILEYTGQPWLSSIVILGVAFYLIYRILQVNEIEAISTKVMIYALSAVILVSTIYAPSISGAMVIILLSFMVNYKTGLAIGIIALIYFVSQYYYDLSFTLLTKSIILFTSGVVFLLLYLLTTKMLPTDEKI